ncbi:MAG: hypothetical protein ACN6QI_14010 [Pseudomonas sp.]|uniref:hypothetical protein n=1 Tax=Pseudomonas sp. TaxID=306 RepID=UPI002ACCB8A9|nr:hypothetical protein [Pseudomonas putida]HEN8719582.1 hypothetical protein [Pseudomonas putida]
MRRDHQLLQWLSIDQALGNLCNITREPISEEDLLSLCEEGRCSAYYPAGGIRGKTQVASLEEKPEEVFGAGYQKILNASDLRGALGTDSIQFRFVGPVFSTDPDDFEESICLWEAVVADSRRKIRFKTTDIQALADTIMGPSRNEVLDVREKRSLLALIAVLAQMDSIDITEPYKAAGIIEMSASRLGLWVPGEDTIVKHLKLAVSAKQP